MSDPFRIRLVDAGKRFTKYEDVPMLLSALRFRTRTRRGKLWAVRHVDLEMAPGETVGIIGRNGSGKSTTLQMLAGVTAPTEGRVSVRGRVAPLISVGVGFHPELTGRENIYVNGTILGMSRKMIDARLDSIIDFAEIEEFIETPVKFYSSGMVVRLGFAIAVQAEPDVLLVDEVLAVGDLAFQVKCFDRMNEIKQLGTTVVVVSHNLNAVRLMCERTLLLHRGEVQFDGDTTEAISRFHQVLREPRELENEDGPNASDGGAHVREFRLLDGEGKKTGHVSTGDTLTVDVDVEFERDVANPVVGVFVDTEMGVQVFHSSTITDPIGPCRLGGRVHVQVQMHMRLTTGTFSIWALVVDAPDADEPFKEATTMCSTTPLHCYVSGRNSAKGIADLDATFKTELDPPT